jgi:hypothetical protein
VKKLITAIALTTVMASPVLARTAPHRSVDPINGSGAIYQTEPGRSYAPSGYSYGTDPDPRIQSELRRDPPSDR